MWVIINSKHSSNNISNDLLDETSDRDLSESVKQKYEILFKLEWSRRMCERIL